MVFDVSKKFLIFKKITFLVIFSRKIGKIFFKNPDRAGKEKVVLTGRSTGRSEIPYRTGPDRTGPDRPVAGTGYNSGIL
jgi:hypothetical protein